MNEEILRSKFIGSLIGTAVGDALGRLREGFYMVEWDEVKAVAEERPLLTYTDDTQMMIGGG